MCTYILYISEIHIGESSSGSDCEKLLGIKIDSKLDDHV